MVQGYNPKPPVRTMSASEAAVRRENVKLREENAKQAQLLRRCDVVLTMIPARKEPAPGWLTLFNTEYVAPLLKRMRE